MTITKYSVAILGGGASGLMCALTAARRRRDVIVIEHNEDIGSKLKASGGGRCNFTNLKMGPEHYISENPHFVNSALSRFSPSDIIEMLEAHKIPHEEKSPGQLFCKNSSLDIIKMLKKECADTGVTILSGTEIISVRHKGVFKLSLLRRQPFIPPFEKGGCGGILKSPSIPLFQRGKNQTLKFPYTKTKIGEHEIESESLVVATGGLSYPALGASDLGYRLARQFKMNVTPLRPALVPLLFDRHDRTIFSVLSGISFRGRVTCGDASFTDEILFTFKGLSGPAILQISSYFQTGEPITIDMFPELDIYSKLMSKKGHSGKVLPRNYLSGFISKKFSKVWCEQKGLEGNLASYTKEKIIDICNDLHNWVIVPDGTEGYRKAEATRGGVDTAEISSKTMGSMKVRGLYFIGEALDVVGHLGGYNLHWAWASGHAAGQYV